jgi:Rhodopirellula transposase DDE domain
LRVVRVGVWRWPGEGLDGFYLVVLPLLDERKRRVVAGASARRLGKAIPYGIDGLGSDEGLVSVGDDADTAAFAVTTRRWWE